MKEVHIEAVNKWNLFGPQTQRQVKNHGFRIKNSILKKISKSNVKFYSFISFGGLIQGEKVIEPVEMTLKLANYVSNGGVRQAAGNFVANTPPSLQAARMFVATTNALFICKNERFFYNAEALGKERKIVVKITVGWWKNVIYCWNGGFPLKMGAVSVEHADFGAKAEMEIGKANASVAKK